MSISFKVTGRDEDCTYWQLNVPNVQGKIDISIDGYFAHFKDRPKASYWEISSKAYSNGHEVTQDAFLELLGDGSLGAGEDRLESILSTPMENDYDDWVSWNEAMDREAKSEAALNNAYFEKATGF